MKPVFLYDTPYTHMPYIFNWRNKTFLLCSVFDSAINAWQPGITDWEDESDPIHFLSIASGTNNVCNLCAHVRDEKVCLSYVTNNNNQYRLHWTTTSDFQLFTPPEICVDVECWSGYLTAQHVVFTDMNWLTTINNVTGATRKYQFIDFETIFRVCPIKNSLVLITGMVAENLFTYIFDLAAPQKPLQQIYTDGTEIYKSCIYEDWLVVAKRANTEDGVLNHRKLHYVKNFTTIPAPHIRITVE
jgi:hypothetical protein